MLCKPSELMAYQLCLISGPSNAQQFVSFVVKLTSINVSNI